MSKIIFKCFRILKKKFALHLFASKTNALPDKSHILMAVGDWAQGKQSLPWENTTASGQRCHYNHRQTDNPHSTFSFHDLHCECHDSGSTETVFIPFPIM